MDVKGNLGGLNHVQDNCLEDATMKSSLLNESNKNDEYQRIKFKENKNDLDIDYENDVSEEVDYQELQKIVAPPPLVCEYLERINPSEMEKEKKKRQQQEGSWVPVHPRYPSTFQQQVKPKKRKCKRETGSGASSTGYIPLAFRETKRDAYIYYYK
ncbi:hypothetical protein V6Z12_A11G140500 [Gossypium hirsutum]|uniref:Uncharacterized protein isoform X2 n=2 Tax=Gossypium TaxID=3633 RepID=A0A1U8IF62_GOSHI|nr:uncharacterized protein LOC107923777 isoform X2 [Gossypium hirsutum]TYI00589.1 hypothetical protein ES332_A11G144500v1 [Gossypium tomentosum]